MGELTWCCRVSHSSSALHADITDAIILVFIIVYHIESLLTNTLVKSLQFCEAEYYLHFKSKELKIWEPI